MKAAFPEIRIAPLIPLGQDKGSGGLKTVLVMTSEQ